MRNKTEGTERNLASLQMDYIIQVNRIVKEANERKIRLRAMGGIGIVLHCPNQRKLLQEMNRLPSDLDFMALIRQEKQIEELFRDLGYTEKGGQGITMEIWSNRRIYEHPVFPHTDIFFDELDFCHRIDFRKRMNIDSPAVSPADLMLGKLQIFEINEKDLQDLIVVNVEHSLSKQDEPDRINAQYIADVLAQDWGFCYTAVTNLKKAQKLTQKYCQDMLAVEAMQKAYRQIGELL